MSDLHKKVYGLYHLLLHDDIYDDSNAAKDEMIEVGLVMRAARKIRACK